MNFKCFATYSRVHDSPPFGQWARMKEGVEPLPLAFQYLILKLWRPCDLNLVMISSLASKCQDFKVGMPVFQHFMKWNWRPLSLKFWHFEASEDIMTKFKLQGVHIIRIKYWNARGSGPPPSLWNIDIFLHKQAKRCKDMQHSVFMISGQNHTLVTMWKLKFKSSVVSNLYGLRKTDWLFRKRIHSFPQSPSNLNRGVFF